MGSVALLWNSRHHPRLRRYWLGYGELIVVSGERPGQTGVLSVVRSDGDRLRARLQVMGREFEQVIGPGQDIAISVAELALFIGVKAVEDERVMVTFGMPAGARLQVILGGGYAADPPEAAFLRGVDRDTRGLAGAWRPR